MEILEKVKRIPGGLMVVPMLVTAAIHTFWPSLLTVGSPVDAIFTSKGMDTLIGLCLFAIGTTLRLDRLKEPVRQAAVVLAVKTAASFGACLAVPALVGLDGIWGLSSLAILCGITSCSTSIYLAAAEAQGTEADVASMGLFSILGIPVFQIFVLCASSGGGMDWKSVMVTLAPFVLGIILGNLDQGFRSLAVPAMPLMIVFMGFGLGAEVNLLTAMQSGFGGVLLGLICLAVNGPIHYLMDRFLLQRNGCLGVALCAVSGMSVAVPALAAERIPAYAPYVEAAASQVATAMVVTSFLVPAAMGLIRRRAGRHKGLGRLLKEMEKKE